MNTPTDDTKQLSSKASWLAIISLTCAAFIFNTTEFVPVGILPDIANSFSMDVAHTGLLITGYAWCVTIMSLPLTIWTAKIERKKLLIMIFLLFVVGHILAGVAWNFATLMFARVVIAFSHSIFWAITAPLAVRLAPIGKKARALSMIVAGTSIATVFGVPIGTIIGQHVGWRVTFLCIAVVAALVLCLLANLLPKLPSSHAGSFNMLPSLLKRPALIQAYLLIAIIIIGHFTAYTYITPFLTQVGGFPDSFVVVCLLIIGVAGIIGSMIYAKLLDKYPKGILIGAIGGMLISLLLLHVAILHEYAMMLVSVIWGMSIIMVGLIIQTKVLEVASDASDMANSMYSGIYNIGIGGGALIGSKVLIYAGTTYVGYFGALFVAIALALFCFVSVKCWTVQKAK